MTETSDKVETKLDLDANVISTSMNGDLLQSTIDEIVKILELDHEDDCEMGEQIARDLLENGRNALIKHEHDIIRRVFVEIMNDDSNKLMDVLRNYFRQKWETQYASSNPWFISFLKEYENGENHDIYKGILTRTAQYGNKYMKDCPVLSIVLQLLSKGIDDHCLEKTNNVFDDLWTTITDDGKQSITKYSEYLIKEVLDKNSIEDIVLFEALREYYRPNVFLSLKKSGIRSRQNLYNLALNNVVEYGWLSDMESIKTEITPNQHQTLLKELRSFHKKQELSPNNDSLSSTKQDRENDGGQESAADENQVKIIESLPIVSAQAISSKEEAPSSSNDSMANEDIETRGAQKVRCLDAIFISGLPTDIAPECLIDKLNTIFSSCGTIKTYEKTNQPDIWLSPSKGKRNLQLNGTAMVKFEKEESAIAAIKKYNGRQVPELSNVRISIRFYKTEQKHDQSVSSNILRNDIDRHKAVDASDAEVFIKDTIYITHLPTNMSEKLLFDTLWDEFNTAGSIKKNNKTKQPCICLYKLKGSKIELSGRATVRFNNEESVTKAIDMYNGKVVPSLNGSRLYVCRFKQKPPEPFRVLRPVPMCPPEQPNGPVSIFWDIENVAIPRGNKAFDIVFKLRKRLIEDRKLLEGTFKTYYRMINSASPQHLSDLHLARVQTDCVASERSQAMDLQILKDLQRFRAQQKTPATVVLISGDIDFIQDINELRYRGGHYTIIIHKQQAKSELLKTANETIPWEEFVETKSADKILKDQTYGGREPKDKSARNFSAERKPAQSRACDSPTNPSLLAQPLMHLKFDQSAIHEEPRSKKKDHKNKNKRDTQSPNSILSPINNAVEITAVADDSAASNANKIQKAKKKKSTMNVNALSCSICGKTFSTANGRDMHKQNVHKTGILVEIDSTAFNGDTDSHDQQHGYVTPSNHDLMVFSDNDDCDQSQLHSQITIIEKNQSVEVSDDDNSTSSSSSIKDD